MQENASGIFAETERETRETIVYLAELLPDSSRTHSHDQNHRSTSRSFESVQAPPWWTHCQAARSSIHIETQVHGRSKSKGTVAVVVRVVTVHELF